MEFHISRAVRERLDLNDLLFEFDGNVIFADVAASRKLAKQLNELKGEPPAEKVVHGGQLFALGLIDELSHAMIALYRAQVNPGVMQAALKWFSENLSKDKVEKLLLEFVEQFPNVAVYRGEQTAEEWLKAASEGMTHREAALEELLLLWLANGNAAFTPFKELFDDASLAEETAYPKLTAGLEAFFATQPAWSAADGTLLDVLRAPMLASPDSLSGQLDFIRERWAPFLGAELRKALLAIDVLREEDVAIWMQFHPPVQGRFGARGGPDWGAAGFVGDEYIGFEEAERRRRYAKDHQAPLNEYEAFSEDQAWMPNVVLMAKSTYVWLEQLSKKYGQHIHRLDQIPDEELRLMASRGMTGLWLIGLWERSIASRTIKRMRGQEAAVASAYSLKDYRIAEDLGGPAAYEYLRDRAAAAGIRLASDMVPNHMGIDSDWVLDHPDWFISRPVSPFPSYSFEGPDLSTDSRVEIKIEDHYFDQTDAAVVFRLRQRGSGETKFVYHGNDGTTFAWNDTAQLDYSKAYVREHVIQAILHVARMFPIIRFDAAMTLAKRHVQRLWFPLPGVGGSIPSRAESAMTQEEFDQVMPAEFWREVVDRVAVEVPGTLLLAEAFWMLEGYFVRTLGMHRVYNSAFMNMLRDEENAKYRSYLKKTIEFDPDILKRYVNFMSNPDERTTIDQFGSDDKCFGVATMMSTLPGLPMFGHGQIEGFTERYGMEYKRARMDETPNEHLAARHQHEIAPLLKRRHVFAESTNFVLYDFWNDQGAVDENVFAYSNRSGDERAIILYNNAYNSTHGTIHTSAAAMDKHSGQLRQRQLSEAVGLPAGDGLIIGYRDVSRGLSYLRRSHDFEQRGMSIGLHGYQYVVLQDWRMLQSTAEYPWDRLCDALGGAGVHNLDEALSKLRLRPLHEALREALRRDHVKALLDVSQEAAALAAKTLKKESVVATRNGGSSKAAVDPRLHGLLEAGERFQAQVRQFTGGEADGSSGVGKESLEAGMRDLLRLPALERSFSAAWPASLRKLLPGAGVGETQLTTWAPVLGWLLLQKGSTPVDQAQFDELHLRAALAEIFTELDLYGDDAWRFAARVRILLKPDTVDVAALLGSAAFWREGDVAWLMGLNDSGDKTYFNKEQFEEMLCCLQLPALSGAAAEQALPKIEAILTKGSSVAAEAGYELQRFLELWQKAGPQDPKERGGEGSSEAGGTKPPAKKSTAETSKVSSLAAAAVAVAPTGAKGSAKTKSAAGPGKTTSKARRGGSAPKKKPKA